MKKIPAITALVLATIGITQPAGAVEHFNKTVSIIERAPAETCFYFTLNGVTVADPIINGPWFAVSTSDVGGKDMLAMLITAKTLGLPVRVLTNGTTSCGYTKAFSLQLL